MRHTWAHMFSDKWWWRSYVLVMLFLVSFNDKGLVVFIHFNAEFLHISSTKVYRLWVCSSSPSSMAQMSSPGAGGAFACKERHLVVEGDPCRQAEHLQSFFFFPPLIIGWSNRQLGGLHSPRPFGSVCPSQQTICEDFQADESDPCDCSQELSPTTEERQRLLECVCVCAASSQRR